MEKPMKSLIPLLILLPLPALAQGPGYGAALAERWCMACHIVEPAPKTASANGIPSFSAIAAKPTTNAEQLKAYLSTGHTRMPDFSLSNRERQALVDYILSLR
jgi:mono/diheme cytochrome c family protein